MKTKTAFIIFIITFIAIFGVIKYFGTVAEKPTLPTLEADITQTLPNTPDIFEEFNKATSEIGLGQKNISDEKLVMGGAKPYYMRIGFPKSVDYKNGKYFLNIDLALWFNNNYDQTNDMQADLASKEDGALYDGAPNGFYIRNNNHILKTFEVSPTAQIYTIQSGSGEPKPIIHIAEFKTLLEKAGEYNENKFLPFVFDLENNIIVRAYQHYVP